MDFDGKKKSEIKRNEILDVDFYGILKDVCVCVYKE